VRIGFGLFLTTAGGYLAVLGCPRPGQISGNGVAPPALLGLFACFLGIALLAGEVLRLLGKIRLSSAPIWWLGLLAVAGTTAQILFLLDSYYEWTRQFSPDHRVWAGATQYLIPFVLSSPWFWGSTASFVVSAGLLGSRGRA